MTNLKDWLDSVKEFKTDKNKLTYVKYLFIFLLLWIIISLWFSFLNKNNDTIKEVAKEIKAENSITWNNNHINSNNITNNYNTTKLSKEERNEFISEITKSFEKLITAKPLDYTTTVNEIDSKLESLKKNDIELYNQVSKDYANIKEIWIENNKIKKELKDYVSDKISSEWGKIGFWKEIIENLFSPFNKYIVQKDYQNIYNLFYEKWLKEVWIEKYNDLELWIWRLNYNIEFKPSEIDFKVSINEDYIYDEQNKVIWIVLDIADINYTQSDDYRGKVDGKSNMEIVIMNSTKKAYFYKYMFPTFATKLADFDPKKSGNLWLIFFGFNELNILNIENKCIGRIFSRNTGLRDSNFCEWIDIKILNNSNYDIIFSNKYEEIIEDKAIKINKLNLWKPLKKWQDYSLYINQESKTFYFFK